MNLTFCNLESIPKIGKSAGIVSRYCVLSWNKDVFVYRKLANKHKCLSLGIVFRHQTSLFCHVPVPMCYTSTSPGPAAIPVSQTWALVWVLCSTLNFHHATDTKTLSGRMTVARCEILSNHLISWTWNFIVWQHWTCSWTLKLMICYIT